MPPREGGLDLEVLLRSALWRRSAIALGVLLLALVTSLPLYDLLSRQRGVPFLEVLLPRLVLYGAWGLLVEPLLLAARWLRDRSPRLVVRLLLLVPFTVGVALAMSELDEELTDRSRQRLALYLRGLDPGERFLERSDERPSGRPARDLGPTPEEDPRGAGEERGRRSRRPDPASSRRRWWERGQRIRAFSRSLTELWLLLAVGAGVEAYLRSRESERSAARLAVQGARLQAELARAQLGSLSRQLHPHFLFNALHSIGGLVRLGDGRRALAVLADVGSLLRLTLEQGEHQEQSLADELAVVERYLALERLRLGERLEATVEAEEEALAGALPSLLLLPLVENAVRHGVAPREEGGRVAVRARREGQELVVEVRDDGPGFEPRSREGNAGTGIGLANGRERLALLYGERGRLETASDGGARVTVRVPWHTASELEAEP